MTSVGCILHNHYNDPTYVPNKLILANNLQFHLGIQIKIYDYNYQPRSIILGIIMLPLSRQLIYSCFELKAKRQQIKFHWFVLSTNQ